MKTVYDYVGQKLRIDDEVFILVGYEEEMSVFFDGTSEPKCYVGVASFSTGRIRGMTSYLFEAKTFIELDKGLRDYGLIPKDSHAVFI